MVLKIGLKIPTYTPQPSTSGSSSPSPIPTIVHLSIRLYQPLNEDPKKNKNKRITIGLGLIPCLPFGCYIPPFFLYRHQQRGR